MSVIGQEPGEISENTAKQNVAAQQHNHIESMAIEDEDALGYETDEDEFDPGSRSSRPSNMHLVTLGQSNWSPGDTLLIKTECPQVQDEHPWLKTACEKDDENGHGVIGMEVVYETDEEEFEREDKPVNYCINLAELGFILC